MYARKFLKENNFALSKENIQQVSQNIAKNRANNKKQNRDSSVEAAYKIEKEKLSDPATRSNYQKSINLKVFTDKNSVEFFFPNGQAYTVARFNTSNTQDFKIFTEDPTNGNRVDITQKTLN